MALWLFYGFVLPVLPLLGVGLGIADRDAFGVARAVAGNGELAIAAVGINVSAIALVVTSGIGPRLAGAKLLEVAVAVSLIVLTAVYYGRVAVVLGETQHQADHVLWVSVVLAVVSLVVGLQAARIGDSEVQAE